MNPQPTHTQKSPQEAILEIIGGFWISRAVFAAAQLGLADAAGDRPVTVQDLARSTGTHAPSLYRLMRALVAYGIFRELPGRRFAQTGLSEMLRSDVPGSMRWTAISELGQDHYAAWEELEYSLRTGDTAFHKRFGMSAWQFYAENPENGQTFERSMTGLTQRIHDAIISAYDFDGYRKIMDVGGGEGALLSHVLAQNRAASGIVFDVPEVIELAKARLSKNGGGPRCLTAAGDFFEALPDGADLHMMKWIIHDWDDAKSARILRNSRAALAPGGKLLLMEMVLPENDGALFAKLMDLNMLVMTGGCERTESEYRHLLESCGYRLNRVIPTESPISILEASGV